MTLIELEGKNIYLPCSDEKLNQLNVLIRSGYCKYTEPINIAEKIKDMIKVRELNMLAFTLQKFSTNQIKKFSELIKSKKSFIQTN